MSSSEPATTVRRRRVFYIPGYDPIHPRRYRELYRKESAAQAGISGYEVGLKPKTTKGPYGWHVASTQDGVAVAADVEVLVWSDIVRDSMSSTIPATYLQLARTAWTYIMSGALWRLMKLRKGPVIAALYPVGMLLLQLLLAVLLCWGVTRAVMLLDAYLPSLALQLVGLVLGLGAGIAVLRWFRARDGKFFAYYLMHDYAYSAQSRGANPPELDARIAAFTELVADALQSDADEVLVVGHSSGAHVGVSVLADLIRQERVPAEGPALGFLSLGQVVPMVSFLPDATRLRADLQYLSTREELAWVDVSAPGDGCAFALCDPVTVSGVAPEDKRWPLVFSAAFTQTLSPERWSELRWRFFRLHFQYLCAFDRPGDYDYFRITAGPMTLAERYRDRAPSKSRIDVAVSKYTSVAAA
ncbi:hypothetical protein [Falsiruegeria mediterranea]|uniref:Fungal lipase-like domain-containing protein n=1 Tax=Falsiruegeria mediterranea M17 TaxID=1200281 RepID=A0A2R8C8M8_9RHOB|nr:hypothetical protein [Falsiruegeria mediterranea]SPJ28723.1 hypothetical protein TRM7615_02228 [Falsiruegeria mediterranea M17]